MLLKASLLVTLVLAVASSLVAALPSATGNRVLVVIEEAAKPSYSTFLDSLSSRGYTLSFKAPRTVRPALVEHDVPQFDHLIVLAPNSRALAVDLSPQLLVEYLKLGGNVVSTLDSSSPDLFHDFAREFSLEFEPKGSALVDHFNTLSSVDSGNHTAVLVGGKSATGLSSGGLVPNLHVFSESTLAEAKTKPLLYRGLVHRVGSNPLAFPLILPPATSYSSETPTLVSEDQDASEQSTSYSTPAPVTITTTKVVDGTTVSSETLSTPRPVPTVISTKKSPKFGKDGWVAKDRTSLEPLDQRKDLIAGGLTRGSDLVSLVSAFQVQSNSARAVFLGSAEMLSNSFFNPSKAVDTLNAQVAHDLTAWTFQEKSVLQVANTHHRRVRNDPTDTREDYEENGENGETKMYRIKDTVYYSVDLIAHDPKLGWIPARSAVADLDLQVEFRMLDPYITARLTPIDKTNTSSISPLDPSAAPASQQDAATTYQTTFQVPDRHGVFTFVLNYKRHGLTFLQKKDTAPVRPFNHDEYPRFLSSSWPYITGAFSTVAAFVLFVFLWLTTKEDLPRNKKHN